MKLVEQLEMELASLARRRDLLVEQAVELLKREATSRHLGHNLGSRATELAELAAKVEQTEMILRSAKEAL